MSCLLCRAAPEPREPVLPSGAGAGLLIQNFSHWSVFFDVILAGGERSVPTRVDVSPGGAVLIFSDVLKVLLVPAEPGSE